VFSYALYHVSKLYIQTQINRSVWWLPVSNVLLTLYNRHMQTKAHFT